MAAAAKALLFLSSLVFFSVTQASPSQSDASHNSVQRQYRVAILDRFFPPVEGFSSEEQRGHHLALYGLSDIDEDEESEPFYHGDLVKMLAAHRNITFINYPIHNNQAPMTDILRNLRKINTRMEVQPLDGLVLSWESSTLISTFEQPLRRSRATAYKATLRKMGQDSPVWKNTWLIIQELEKLAAQGVAVYTIAGNGGRKMINTFSLAKGVITVGAIEQELEHFVANNVFVDTFAQAAYQLKRVDSSSGQPLGYDMNDDGCVDIPIQRLTSFRNPSNDAQQYPKTFWKVLRGSSFAAPTALKMALLTDRSASCS